MAIKDIVSKVATSGIIVDVSIIAHVPPFTRRIIQEVAAEIERQEQEKAMAASFGMPVEEYQRCLVLSRLLLPKEFDF